MTRKWLLLLINVVYKCNLSIICNKKLTLGHPLHKFYSKKVKLFRIYDVELRRSRSNQIKQLSSLIYGIKGTNLAWLRRYLTNRKQCIQITNDSKSDLQNTTFGVQQSSILGPRLFLVYVNDISCSSKILNPIMCADATNLFNEHKNIIKLFATVNEELRNRNDWLMANKLSLNVGKTKYSLFHKPSNVDDLPLKLPKLNINNQEIKKEHPIQKVLEFYTENKIAKSTGNIQG